MLNGRTRDIGFGPAAGVDAIALSAARDLASALRLKVKAGIDPLEERQREAAEALAAAQAAQVAGVTFKTVAETYIATNEGSWRNDKHRQRSEEHTSELPSLMSTSYAVFCLKQKILSQHQQCST